MKSIIQKTKKCYLCGTEYGLDDHHIFGGANRVNSEKYGIKVWLCRRCHDRVHFSATESKVLMTRLRKMGQKAFEKNYPTLDFLKIFHYNYLDDDDRKEVIETIDLE